MQISTKTSKYLFLLLGIVLYTACRKEEQGTTYKDFLGKWKASTKVTIEQPGRISIFTDDFNLHLLENNLGLVRRPGNRQDTLYWYFSPEPKPSIAIEAQISPKFYSTDRFDITTITKENLRWENQHIYWDEVTKQSTPRGEVWELSRIE
jgi:hypothetical protein